MIKAVQKKIGRYLISLSVKKRKEKKIFNFHSAKNMGIVFVNDDEWNMKILKDFIQTAKKNDIQISAIGWINEKEISSKFEEDEIITFLTKKDLNFWGLPNSEKISNFIARKYDILVDFSLYPNIITSFISAKTNAKMKIAKDMDETKSIFDFLLKLDGNIKQNEFTEQVTYYLNTINLAK